MKEIDYLSYKSVNSLKESRLNTVERNELIRQQHANGMTVKQLADEYGRKTITIKHIIADCPGRVSQRGSHNFILKTKKKVRITQDNSTRPKYSDGDGMTLSRTLWKHWANANGYKVDGDNGKDFTIINPIRSNKIIKTLVRI